MLVEQLLIEAQREIIQLRKTNQLQAARLEVFDTMKLFLNTQPNYQQSAGMHPDIVRSIDGHLAVLKAKADPSPSITREGTAGFQSAEVSITSTGNSPR